VRGYARDAKSAEEILFMIFPDPGGIGSAFHRAEDGENHKTPALRAYTVDFILQKMG